MSLRNNWFDGQQVTNTDLDIEQQAWLTGTADAINVSIGSGVKKEFAVQRSLFDTNNVPQSVINMMNSPSTANAFDGTPIFQNDAYNLPVFSQPSDSTQGNMLEVVVSGANLIGSFTLQVYIFGQIFGGAFSYEVLTFTKNESQTTQKYFTNISAIMTQNYMGNSTNYNTRAACRVAGGRIQILESIPMTVVRDTIMIEQAAEPNMDFINFIPANAALILGQLLEQIATINNLNSADLQINTISANTITLPPNVNGIIVGQKFKATTNNIQKVSILLSSLYGGLIDGYDWSGNIAVGIRKLQTTVSCPSEIVPGLPIQFDPSPVPLIEMSFTQTSLANIGIVLGTFPQVVDFVFTNSVVANTSSSSSMEIGQFYMITISRSGDISKGTLVVQEASNITTDSTLMRLSVFSQNAWTDIVGSNTWFKIYTSAARITNGIAYDNGIQIVSPKVLPDLTTGIEVPFSENHHSLLNTAPTTDNYVIVQAQNSFSTPIPHPATGNPVFTKVQDIPGVSVVSQNSLLTLITSGNNTIVLGDVKDINNTLTSNLIINGTGIFPGLAGTNTFTIIHPPSQLLANNLVGSYIIPDQTVQPNTAYRIIEVEVFSDTYGDVNGDGVIDFNDVNLAQMLSNDSYSSVTFSADQINAIVDGYISIEEILRACVDGGNTVNGTDVSYIQEFVSLGISHGSLGSIFTRMVLTVESVLNPTTTTVDVVGSDTNFNNIVSTLFPPLAYRVNMAAVWKSENVVVTDLRRFVVSTLTSITSTDITGSPANGGTNTLFVPGDLELEGQLKNLDGTTYSIDLEVGTIILNLPDGYFCGEVDIFNNFIKGVMRFYDGTLVGSSALANNQIRVTAAIQSISQDYHDGYFDVLARQEYPSINRAISVLYTQSSGSLRIRTDNTVNVPTRPELNTKIILTVYLKRAGFKNTEQVVSGSQLENLKTVI